MHGPPTHLDKTRSSTWGSVETRRADTQRYGWATLTRWDGLMSCHDLISWSPDSARPADICWTFHKLISSNQRGLIFITASSEGSLFYWTLPLRQSENMELCVPQLTEKGHIMVMGCFDGTHLQTEQKSLVHTLCLKRYTWQLISSAALCSRLYTSYITLYILYNFA